MAPFLGQAALGFMENELVASPFYQSDIVLYLVFYRLKEKKLTFFLDSLTM